MLDPPASGLALRDAVRTSARGGGSLLTIRRIAGTDLVVDGSIAATSAAVVRNVAVVSPTVYCERLRGCCGRIRSRCRRRD
jgi:hypothetical protein